MEANLPENEKARLATLDLYRVLDTLPEQTYDDLTQLASSICDTPMALITFLDEQRQWFKAKVGVDIRETPRAESFCAHTILQPQEMMIVPDARQDSRFADNPFVQGEPHIRFYAGAPLTTSDGYPLGTICVIDDTSRQLTAQQKQSLQALARQVMVHLELRRSEVGREQVEKAKHFLASIVESSEDSILTINFDRVITSWNKAAERLYGYSAEEVIGQPLTLLTLPKDLEQVLINVDRIKHSQSVETFDTIRVNKDGRELHLEVVLSPVKDAVGKVIGISTIARDITQRKQVEQKLQETTREIVTIWESMSDAFFSLDTRWRFTHVNGQGAQVLGKSSQELIGASLWEISPQLIDTEFDRRYRKAMEGQAKVNFEEFYAPANRWYEVRAYPSPDRLSVYFHDITDRKEAEFAIVLSEERYRSLVQATAQIIWAVGPDGQAREDMPTWRSYTGQSLEEAQGWGWINAVHPDDRELALEAWAQSVRTQSLYETEFRLRDGDGSYRLFAVRGVPVLDTDGSIREWVGTCTDIHDRRAAEEERDRFFTLSLDMLCIIGNDGYIKRLNPAFEATLGFSKAEMMAVPFMEFVHPEDHPATREAVKVVEAGSRLWSFENRYRCRDGSYKWLHWTSAPFEGLWYCVARDVTQVKAAEAALLRANDELERHVMERTAQLQASNQALLDNEARLLQGNSIFTDLTRLRVTSEAELQEALAEVTQAGSILLDVDRCSVWLFNDDQSALCCLDLFQRSLQQHSEGAVILVEEYPAYFGHSGTRAAVVAEDAHTHPATYELSAGYLTPLGISSMIDAPIVVGGEMVGVLCCEHVGPRRRWQVEDQTFAGAVASICALAIESVERARAEALLRQAKEEAEAAYREASAANAAKSEFLSRMSHELRTPLNAILGFGQILERQQLNALQQESVDHILKGGHHLLGLINEVLDISRVESGSVELSIEPVSLEDVVNEAFALVNALAAQHGVYLELDRPAVRGLFPLADRQRLRQVLVNLISNAIKYNYPGGRVVVSAQRVEDGRLRISIADSGKGLSAHEIEKLFTPFERFHAANSVVEGTGLGLVISQRLITAMEGTLGVESEVGTGSTFWIDLPLTPITSETSAEQETSQMSLDTGATNQASLHTYAVLNIEDTLSNMRLMEVVLASRPEITLLGAMQGSIGLAMAREHQPDVILLDLHLPDLSGHEVLEHLQRAEETKNIPVIVVSADATPKQIERLRSAGAIAYLTKPLDVATFLNTLDQVLQVKG